ncbi:MAG TPA: hypothetical protein VHT00_14215 [Stellaceae bacterium]|jgi:hypothetical protein|nr:hypothetical protein [Stellaceae bacterium]
MADDLTPVEEDLRTDDQEFNPALEPKKAKAWLNLLTESEDAFERYNEHCDNIDKQYANLERLSNQIRDKEFQMFWANAEVIKPSIYAQAPVPVVVPKFMDRRPVYQAAAETMERCAVVAFDLAEINELMKLVRDDLALADRGVAWCRYQAPQGNKPEMVCIDFKNRRDFLHSISRNWREVNWVAGASYLTRGEARKRFRKASGDEYQRAEYRVDKDTKEVGGADNRERAKFWEIWSKSDRRVVWVAEGCTNILDEDDPHLDLRGFFPCPKPAYGTVQRGSLVPVPDVLQYKDQLEEINLLTGKIHALSDAIEAKGFYPAGGSEMAEAIQAAINLKTPGRVLVPISNWAAFGGSKDVIIWLPIDVIAQTITGLVALRKQVIDDIYQIMGLSDIMRGATSPEETLGAQQLKTQYGSVRVRDKQQELVRIARDLVEIITEIITEKFDAVTMIEMSQTNLPTTAQVQQQISAIGQQMQQMQMRLQQMQQQPPPPGALPPGQGQAPGQPPGGAPPSPPGSPPPPDPMQQMMQQIQGQLQQGAAAIAQLQAQPTIEQVLRFLKDRRAKAFVLDIETDSTIVPDEQAEKQGRAEFVGVLAQLLPQLAQMMQAEPKTATFCGEILKFATAPYRAGRSLEGAIDDLVEQMKQKADQPQGDDPTTAQNKTAIQIEQMKLQQQRESDAANLQLQRDKMAQADAHKQQELANQRMIASGEQQTDQASDAAKVQVQGQKMQESAQAHQADMVGKQQDMAIQREKADLQIEAHQQRAQQNAERAAAEQFKINNTPPGGGGLR